MLDKLKHILQSAFPELKGAKILVAVSGGVDSMVLLGCMQQLGYHVALAHVNYQLREKDSDLDEALVKKMAHQWGLNAYFKKVNTKKIAQERSQGIQEVAREIRYHFFDEIMAQHEFDYLLTAHHADDDIETFLMHAMRKSGIHGLAAIPAKRDQIRRPLLEFTKDELMAYALDQKWTWREDVSNESSDYLRNKIRKSVVPEIKKIGETQYINIHGTIDILKHQAALWAEMIRYFSHLSMENHGTYQSLNFEKLIGFGKIEDLLIEILKPFQFDAEEIRKIYHAQSGKWIENSTYQIVKDRGQLLIKKLEISSKYVRHFNTFESLNSFTVEHSKTELERQLKYVDKNKLCFPITYRPWQEGDYFFPKGMSGKKKISKELKDRKINILDKENIYVLADVNNNIVLIEGLREDKRYITC